MQDQVGCIPQVDHRSHKTRNDERRRRRRQRRRRRRVVAAIRRLNTRIDESKFDQRREHAARGGNRALSRPHESLAGRALGGRQLRRRRPDGDRFRFVEAPTIIVATRRAARVRFQKRHPRQQRQTRRSQDRETRRLESRCPTECGKASRLRFRVADCSCKRRSSRWPNARNSCRHPRR